MNEDNYIMINSEMSANIINVIYT